MWLNYHDALQLDYAASIDEWLAASCGVTPGPGTDSAMKVKNNPGVAKRRFTMLGTQDACSRMFVAAKEECSQRKRRPNAPCRRARGGAAEQDRKK